MQALNNQSIKLKNENERFELLQNLKNSYNKVSSSPKLKLSNNNDHSINKNNSYINEINSRVIDKNNLPFPEKGKKHFNYHPSLDSNVSLVFKDKYDDSKERIDQLVNFYKEISGKEQKYQYSPEIFSFYNKDQSDPLKKYSYKIRATNLSTENPNYVIGNFIF